MRGRAGCEIAVGTSVPDGDLASVVAPLRRRVGQDPGGPAGDPAGAPRHRRRVEQVIGGRAVFDPETFTAVSRLLAEHEPLMATMEGRRALLREIVRVVVARNYHVLAGNHAWRLHSALAATLGATRGSDARKKIAVALEETQSRTRDLLVELFGYLVETLGLRLRDPARTVEHFQMAGSMLVQGLATRNAQVQAAIGDTGEAAQVDNLLNAPLPGPGLDGEPAEWTLAAFAYLGVLDAFIELDPDFVPPG